MLPKSGVEIESS